MHSRDLDDSKHFVFLISKLLFFCEYQKSNPRCRDPFLASRYCPMAFQWRREFWNLSVYSSAMPPRTRDKNKLGKSPGGRARREREKERERGRSKLKRKNVRDGKCRWRACARMATSNICAKQLRSARGHSRAYTIGGEKGEEEEKPNISTVRNLSDKNISGNEKKLFAVTSEPSCSLRSVRTISKAK